MTMMMTLTCSELNFKKSEIKLCILHAESVKINKQKMPTKHQWRNIAKYHKTDIQDHGDDEIVHIVIHGGKTATKQHKHSLYFISFVSNLRQRM